MSQASHGQPTYTDRQGERARTQKQAIARYAASLIPTDYSVFLDAGSTVEFVAREIFRREAETAQSLTIMTNNMRVFNCFNADQVYGGPPPDHSLRLLLTGGRYDKDHDALFGSQASTALESFYPRVVVVGTSGFTVSEGLFYHGDTPEQVIKEAIYAKPTEHRIIVCDHSKIGKTDSFLAGRFDRILGGTERCTIVTSQPDEKTEKAEATRLKREANALQDRLNRGKQEDPVNWTPKLCLVVIGADGTIAQAYGDKELPPQFGGGPAGQTGQRPRSAATSQTPPSSGKPAAPQSGP